MKRFTHINSINAVMRQYLKFRLWGYAILLSGSLLGCATPPVHLTSVLDRPNMDRIYFEGRAFTFSFGEKSSVGVTATVNGDELILLMLCVSHMERIDVIPEDIRVLGHYKPRRQDLSSLSKVLNYNGTSTANLKVYPPTEYMAERRNAQNWSLVLQALSGALDAQDAGKSTSTTYGSYGGKSFYERTATNDRAAADKALAKRKKELGQTVEKYAQANAARDSILLKAHTIFKDQVVSGMVVVRLHNRIYQKIVVTIPWVEEEPHRITLIQ